MRGIPRSLRWFLDAAHNNTRATADPRWLYGEVMRVAVESIRVFCNEADPKLLDARLPALAARVFESR